MSSQFGVLFRVMTWGESHGGGVGVVIDGCPPKIAISEQDIQVELDRRRPGQSEIVTRRKEADQCEILSGLFEGKPWGRPSRSWFAIRTPDRKLIGDGDGVSAFSCGFHVPSKIRDPKLAGRRESIRPGNYRASGGGGSGAKGLGTGDSRDRSDRLRPADTHDRSRYRLACGDVARCGKLNRQVPTAGDSRENDRADPNDAQRG